MNILSVLIYFSAFTYGLFIFIVLMGWLEINKKKGNSTGDSSSFTIVIPFKNEEKHLPTLLNSLAQQTFDDRLKEIIFIDDSSSDASVKLIKEHTFKNGVRVISNQFQAGKKGALQTAWYKCKSQWVIQLDADVQLENNWYSTISSQITNNVALYILPIQFQAHSFLQKIFAFEFSSLSMFSLSMVGLQQPVLANGAHMAYRTYNLDEICKRKDWNKSKSGDDIAILSHFKEHEMNIDTLVHPALFCSTISMKSLASFLNQRLRWVSKTKFNLFSAQALFGLFVLFKNALFLFAIVAVLSSMAKTLHNACLCFIFVKIVFDLLFFIPILRKTKRTEHIFFYFILFPIYPVYVVFLTLVGIFKNGNWKDSKP